MGIVYRARDLQLERDVAVKVLNAKALSEPSARKRFRREALILSRLNHPNVEAVYDFQSEEGLDYLVLEYVPGVCLDEWIQRGALRESDVISIGIQLASGLAAAHAQGVVHRDLKPGNLKLTPDNTLKILDFGLAQLVALPEEGALAETESVQRWLAGTPPYISPEQMAGKDPNARSDIYSAGVVLYELATRSRPFPQNGTLLLEAILKGGPPSPRSINKRVSQRLEFVILKCLQKDPNLRYQEAKELASDLRRISAGEQPLIAGPNIASAKPRRWRSLAIIFAALLIILATAAVTWRKLTSRATAPRLSVVVAEFENRTGEPVFDQTPRELISTALGQSPQVSVFPSSRLPEVLRRMQKPETVIVDANVGSEICTREGLQSVISGSLSKLGNSYIVLVRVLKCNGDPLMTIEKRFSAAEQLPPAMDEIAAMIRHKWGESRSDIRQDSQPLALVTSHSLEALKLFSLGKQQLYLDNFGEAASLFTKAIGMDSDFAMAHEGLAITYEHLGVEDRAGEEYAKAAQLSGHTTEREREKILGDYALFQYDTVGAISHYQVLNALSPEDPAVHLNLAECYRFENRFDLAISETTKAAALTPSLPPRINLATYYYLSGDSERAMTLAKQLLSEIPGNIQALNLIASYYLGVGKEADADGIWRQMLPLGRSAASIAHGAMADAARTRDNLGEAIGQLAYGLMADEEMHNTYEVARKEILLAELYRASGDRAQLVASFQKLQEPSAPELTFLLGRLYARAGRISGAERQLHRLEESGNRTPRAMSFLDMLRSDIAVAEGRNLDAIESASLAVQHLNSALAIETLARAYEVSGKPQEAASEYESLLVRTNERQLESVDSPAFYAIVDARYHLGAIYETLKRDDLAQRQFSSLLKYASDGRSTGPLYEAARTRLSQLSAKTSSSAGQHQPHTK